MLKLCLAFLFINFNFASEKPNFVIMGPPGAGKGSFSQFMKLQYDYVPICVGDRLKEHVRKETKIGLEIKPIIERGDFVVPEIGNNILREELLLCLNLGKNFIVDGFVRNLEYFNYMDSILQEFNCSNKVIFLVFSHNKEVSIKRIMERIICNNCGEIYNTQTKKPNSFMTCNICGNKLEMRIDDKNKEIVEKRFTRYLQDSLSSVEVIQLKYKVINIDSNKEWKDLEGLYQKLPKSSVN